MKVTTMFEVQDVQVTAHARLRVAGIMSDNMYDVSNCALHDRQEQISEVELYLTKWSNNVQ